MAKRRVHSGQVAIHTSGRDSYMLTDTKGGNNAILLTLPPPLDQVLSSLSNMLLSLEHPTVLL